MAAQSSWLAATRLAVLVLNAVAVPGFLAIVPHRAALLRWFAGALAGDLLRCTGWW